MALSTEFPDSYLISLLDLCDLFNPNQTCLTQQLCLEVKVGVKVRRLRKKVRNRLKEDGRSVEVNEKRSVLVTCNIVVAQKRLYCDYCLEWG